MNTNPFAVMTPTSRCVRKRAAGRTAPGARQPRNSPRVGWTGWVVVSLLGACQAAAQSDAAIKSASDDAPESDLNQPLAAPPVRVEPVPDEFSVAEYALLGARHDLSYSGPSAPVCRCLAVSLQSRPDHESLRWQMATPRLEPTTQWVIALSSDSVECPASPAGTLGASYQGYDVVGSDVVVHVEALGEGRPMTNGAVIPRPHPGGSVYVESSGSVYGKPLRGGGRRCRIAPPAQ